MNVIKLQVIKNSKYGSKYSKLLFENSLHNFNDLNELYKDNIFLNCIFYSIIYGNSKSKCKKKLTLHTRLNNLFDEDKHQVTTEFENLYRLNMKYHFITIICIFIILAANYLRFIL